MEYKVYKWSDVLTIINGRNQNAVECEDGEYPIYGSGGVMGKANDYLCPPNCTIIGRKGNINKPIYVETKFWNVDTAFGLSANEEILNPRYLYYFCVDYNFERHNKAVTIPSLTKADLLKIEMCLPTLNKQKSIVEELDKINELICLKKEQLKDYDNLAQSIFYEMFGDEKYERRKLKNIVKVKSGQVSPLEDPYCDMVHVGPANIESNTGRLINLKTAKEENLISGKYLFDSSMVLYSKIRPNLNKVTIADFEGICSADMYPLIPSKSIDKKFLLFILKQKEFLSYAIANSGRANIPKINREDLLEYSTILPPLSLQLQFAERLALIEQQKAEIQNTIADLETLLASRMQYWFD